MLGFIHFLPPSIRAAASPTSRERAPQHSGFERAIIALSRNDSVAFQEILQKDWSLLHHLVSLVDFPAITQPLSSMMQEIMQTLSPTELIQWRGFDVNYCPTSGPMHVVSHFICFLVIFENMHGCSTATEILGTTSEEYITRNMGALAQAQLTCNGTQLSLVHTLVEYDRRDLLHLYLDTHNSLVDCTLDPERCGFTPLALALFQDRSSTSKDSPTIRTLLTYRASLTKDAQSFDTLHDKNKEGIMLYHEFLKGLGPLDAAAPAPPEPAPETDEDLQEAIAKAVAIACYESKIRVERGETLDSMKVFTGHGREFVLKICQLFSEITGEEPVQFRQQFFAEYHEEPAPGFDMEVLDRDSNVLTFHGS